MSRYASCHPKIPNFELRSRVEIGKLHKRPTVSLAYIPGGQRLTILTVGLLGRGATPPRLDEDAPTAASKVAIITPKVVGTY
jgi:hypothetical protein